MCGRSHARGGEIGTERAVVRARTCTESAMHRVLCAVCVQIPATVVTDRPDPYRSVSRDLLAVLADEGRPMSLRDLECSVRLGPEEARRQLSVARVAGFVRSTPSGLGGRGSGRPPPGGRGALEPAYQPTALGYMIARRSRAHRLARDERRRPAA